MLEVKVIENYGICKLKTKENFVTIDRFYYKFTEYELTLKICEKESILLNKAVDYYLDRTDSDSTIQI